jgi:hypothetical protein
MTPREPSSFSLLLWDYRFKFRRIQMSWSRIRLGARASRALSRILTSDELPFDVLGMRFERAYKNRKEIIPLQNPSKAYSHQIVVERSFAIAGVNRYINIAVRPYTSVEEVTRAYDYFTELTKKRYSYIKNSKVTESEIAFDDALHVRLIETQGEYMGDNFRILSYASIVGQEMLMVEFQCTATSQWAQNDCAKVLRLQMAKFAADAEMDGS